MKTYTAKFDRNQEVFVLLDKKIFKSTISQVRITERQPYKRILNTISGSLQEIPSVLVEYLICGEYDEARTMLPFNWYSESDVFETKEELIAQIK